MKKIYILISILLFISCKNRVFIPKDKMDYQNHFIGVWTNDILEVQFEDNNILFNDFDFVAFYDFKDYKINSNYYIEFNEKIIYFSFISDNSINYIFDNTNLYLYKK